LNGANFLRADYLRGAVDGIFGMETGRGCKRAKWWLGYPEKDCLPIYGDLLDDLLAGRKKLPATYQARRAWRIRNQKLQPLRVKALNEAKLHLGDKERTGKNDIWVTDWYGVRGPWCAMYVTWCYQKVGSRAFKPGLTGVGGLHPGSGTYAYVPFLVGDARFGRNGLQIVGADRVQPGDPVCFDWDGGVADHIGLFEKWITVGKTFYAIEGNTAIGNDSNGGEVMRRERRVSQVEAFVRVGV
jgi:hypothetical protein